MIIFLMIEAKKLSQLLMDKRIKYFYSNNKLSLYQARNKALEHVSGRNNCIFRC